MTGLDHTRDLIVEIATIVTDDELRVIAEGPDLVLHADDAALEAMDPVVVEMHTRSGLLDGDPVVAGHARRSRPGHVRFHSRAHPRAAHGAVVRELDRHRPTLSRELPARDRELPPLPVGRRLQPEGAREALVSRSHVSDAAQERLAPRARRHPQFDRGAPVVSRPGVRARRSSTANGSIPASRPGGVAADQQSTSTDESARRLTCARSCSPSTADQTFSG